MALARWVKVYLTNKQSSIWHTLISYTSYTPVYIAWPSQNVVYALWSTLQDLAKTTQNAIVVKIVHNVFRTYYRPWPWVFSTWLPHHANYVTGSRPPWSCRCRPSILTFGLCSLRRYQEGIDTRHRRIWLAGEYLQRSTLKNLKCMMLWLGCLEEVCILGIITWVFIVQLPCDKSVGKFMGHSDRFSYV